MGFSLAAIGEMLKLDDPERLDSFYAIRQAELRALASDTEEKLRLLDTTRKRLRKEGNMDHSVSIRTLPERYAACVRMTIPPLRGRRMGLGRAVRGDSKDEPHPRRPLPVQRDLP